MKHVANTNELRIENARLNTRVTELEDVVSELSALVKHFEELFKLSQLKRFGASSEKSNCEQISLFESACELQLEAPEATCTGRFCMPMKRVSRC